SLRTCFFNVPVVECPDERFLEPLENEGLFTAHQAQASSPEDLAFLVVHFSPPEIVKHPKYQRWMHRFASTTNHLIINESNLCKGSIAVHRIQTKLNLLDKQVFPILPLEGVVVAPNHDVTTDNCDVIATRSNDVTTDNSDVVSTPSNGSLQVGSETSSEYMSAVTSVDSSSVTSSDTTVTSSGASDESLEGAVVHSKTFTTVHLRPTKQVDTGDKLLFDKAEYLKEALTEPGIDKVLLELDEKRGQLDASTCHQSIPVWCSWALGPVYLTRLGIQAGYWLISVPIAVCC
ncbi:uncharacterized protein LOC120355981, partial [Nilaparvata lugens]|uniref:uncharacterized protein LOC120355981 n=1 Tax=Nilaparvata lugens TaxID=108931 RepID=UPI00193E7315